MASQHLSLPPRTPGLGCILSVLHDFDSRSPDELSFKKGDKIEVIERDDEFGDGWYLGRNLTDGSTGLFPRVYTDAIPLEVPKVESQQQRDDDSEKDPLEELERSETVTALPALPSDEPQPQMTPPASPRIDVGAEFGDDGTAPRPLNTPPRSTNVQSPAGHPSNPSLQGSFQRNFDRELNERGEDSPVMNETLSVIEEHITDLNVPTPSFANADKQTLNDSASEYSSQLDHRVSCTPAHESDEDSSWPTEEEVLSWNPERTAEYMHECGVEVKHCQVFLEQEITGEVLLGMTQADVFVKEFDLGSVGRRLRTWHKIQTIQHEVKSQKSSTDSTISDVVQLNTRKPESRSSALPRIPSVHEGSRPRPPSVQIIPDSPDPNNPQPLTSVGKSYPRKHHLYMSRPSATSVREYRNNHSRRHSSIDVTSNGNALIDDVVVSSKFPGSTLNHRRQSSFDTGWNMSASQGKSKQGLERPSTSTAISRHRSNSSTSRTKFDFGFQSQEPPSPTSPSLQDRGYFSGGEIDVRRSRNVLRKHDSAGTKSHSRQSSYNGPSDVMHQKSNSLIATAPNFDIFGSPQNQSSRTSSSAAKAYFAGVGKKGRFRSSSARNAAVPVVSTAITPVVTNLEPVSQKSSSLRIFSRQEKNASNGHAVANGGKTKESGFSKLLGFRSASDVVVEGDKMLVASPTSAVTTSKDSSTIPTPNKSGSHSSSLGSRSLEIDTDRSSKKSGSSNHIFPSPIRIPPIHPGRHVKSKKVTSAYMRGLEHKSPTEQMKDCDYSGWMKKKSSHLMTTWKPRLFVLKGRRLSYYYSESDTEEKGLIDISNHKVLPAQNDFLAGLHATITRAASSPSTPSQGTTCTSNVNSTESAALEKKDHLAVSNAQDSDQSLALSTSNQTAPSPRPEKTKESQKETSPFIFKLVPPRGGLSRAVNFTKPTVHYFAVDSVAQGRLWMAALIKATIQRDEDGVSFTTFNQKTISLEKARQRRARPPALMARVANDDGSASEREKLRGHDESGLNIQGVVFREIEEEDVNGVEEHDMRYDRTSNSILAKARKGSIATQ